MKKLLTFFMLLGVVAFGQPYIVGDQNSWNFNTQAVTKTHLGGKDNISFSGVTFAKPAELNQFLITATNNYNDKWGSGYWVPGSTGVNRVWSLPKNGDNAVWRGDLFSSLNNFVHLNIYMPNTGVNPLQLGIMTLSAMPVDITSVTDNLPDPVLPVTVTINLDKAKSPEENIYVRYTKDAWATSSFILANVTGDTKIYEATIPGTEVTVSTVYYVLTTTASTSGELSHSTADLLTIDYYNFGGDNKTLPVELTSFNAAIRNGIVDLKWETATEVNNNGFDVERKTGNADWSKIGFVEGHGMSNSPKYYSFSDKPVGTGKIAYRLKQIDNDGQFEYSPVVEVLVDNLPNGFVMEQNYPNPFNPETSIRFALKEDTKATLQVFNTMGELVTTLFDGIAEAGRYYDIKFSGNDLSSGFYIYKLVAGDHVSVKKMLLMK
jgi:hypothetical protein